MPENDDITANLAALIESPRGREGACRRYLKYAKSALVERTPIEFVYIEPERRGYLGDADYVISCKIREETGAEFVRAYIWELKAPRCCIFEKDNEHRLKPTKELYDAENKLVNYFYESRGSELFRANFGVSHSLDVRMGGIIIGRDNTKVNGNYEPERKRILYEDALRVRNEYFYRQHGIKLFTWNFILDYINPSQPPTQGRVEPGELPSQPLNPERIVLSSDTSEATSPENQ